jgi:transposase
LDFDTKTKDVVVKVGENFETRRMKTLSAQMKQGIHSKMKDSCKALKAAKKKGRKTGKLKFKSRVNSILLKQPGKTFKIKGKRLKIDGIKRWVRIDGEEQISVDAEYANAHLIRKAGAFYLKLTVYKKPELRKNTNEAIGVDLGIKTQMTLSNGIEIRFKLEVPENIREIQRKISRSKRMNGKEKTKNCRKLLNRLEVLNLHLKNKKEDIHKKIVSLLLDKFDYITVQNDSIKSWHSGRYGKQIQESALGGITSRLHGNPRTLIVDRWFASTKLCPVCGCLNDISLDNRVFKCGSCGYGLHRDTKSARLILNEGLKQLGAERTKVKPMETLTNTDTLEYLNKIPGVSASYCL